MPDFSNFTDVSLGSFDEDENCSPVLQEDFRGLEISVPAKIPIQEEMVFPLCGTYQVDETVLMRYRSFENEIVIVVTDLSNNEPYSGNLLEDTFEPDFVEDFEPDEEAIDVVVMGWFNVDLYRQVIRLPTHPGRYQVFATIGEMKSNVAVVELVKP